MVERQRDPRGMLDVAVVGGGPAGCAAAITLARAGRSVVLFERATGTPDGFCGEFLSPDGVGSLDLLGALDRVLAFEPPIVSRWSVHGTSRTLRGALPGPAIGISRRALDPTLRTVAAEAGVDVREGAHIRRIEATSSHAFEVATTDATVQARHVVGAIGRSARVTGLSSDDPPARREFIAFKAHFRGPVVPDEIQLFPLGGVYVGVGGVERTAINVCYLARREAFEAAGSTPEALLDRTAETHPAWGSLWATLERDTERWLSTGGLFFRPRSTVTRSGITLCGDATGLISPFLGEGMSMALEGGCLAGRLVDRHFDEPTVLADLYPRVWRKRFGARMRWGERLQRLLLSHRADSALRWARLIPALPEAIVHRSRSLELTRRGARALCNTMRDRGVSNEDPLKERTR
jgi:flavin-dependent dehydrogenase